MANTHSQTTNSAQAIAAMSSYGTLGGSPEWRSLLPAAIDGVFPAIESASPEAQPAAPPGRAPRKGSSKGRAARLPIDRNRGPCPGWSGRSEPAVAPRANPRWCQPSRTALGIRFSSPPSAATPALGRSSSASSRPAPSPTGSPQSPVPDQPSPRRSPLRGLTAESEAGRPTEGRSSTGRTRAASAERTPTT